MSNASGNDQNEGTATIIKSARTRSHRPQSSSASRFTAGVVLDPIKRSDRAIGAYLTGQVWQADRVALFNLLGGLLFVRVARISDLIRPQASQTTRLHLTEHLCQQFGIICPAA
jgi:hypothetical protein